MRTSDEFGGADPTWVARAQAAYDVLDREAEAGEEGRALTPAALAAIDESGALTMGLPRAFGGGEVDGVTAMAVYEELARADASASWATMAAGMTSAWLSACLPDDGAAEVFGGARPGIIAGMPQPMGKARRVAGGYEFEGRFSFASGSRFASWWVGGAAVEGTERPGGLPDMVAVVVPEDDVVRAGNWDVLGMVATESIDVVIGPCFVPEHRTVRIPLPQEDGNLRWTDIRRRTPVVGAGPVAVGVFGHGGVILGMGRRALEEIAVLAPGRRPMGGPPVSERDSFREELVHHDVALRAIRALLHEVIPRASNEGGPVNDDQLFAAVVHLHDVAGAAIEFAYRWGGTAVLRGSHPLGRLMRDMHAATQHVICDRGRIVAAAGTVLADLTSARVPRADDDRAAA